MYQKEISLNILKSIKKYCYIMLTEFFIWEKNIKFIKIYLKKIIF